MLREVADIQRTERQVYRLGYYPEPGRPFPLGPITGNHLDAERDLQSPLISALLKQHELRRIRHLAAIASILQSDLINRLACTSKWALAQGSRGMVPVCPRQVAISSQRLLQHPTRHSEGERYTSYFSRRTWTRYRETMPPAASHRGPVISIVQSVGSGVQLPSWSAGSGNCFGGQEQTSMRYGEDEGPPVSFVPGWGSTSISPDGSRLCRV